MGDLNIHSPYSQECQRADASDTLCTLRNSSTALVTKMAPPNPPIPHGSSDPAVERLLPQNNSASFPSFGYWPGSSMNLREQQYLSGSSTSRGSMPWLLDGRCSTRLNEDLLQADNSPLNPGQNFLISNSNDHGTSQSRIKHEPEAPYEVRRGGRTDDNLHTGGVFSNQKVSYAQIIYHALLDAQDNRMTLRDIYKWVEDHTDKARDPKSKGWQNSIRHNLSMNGAFTKIPHPDADGKSRGSFVWVLEPSAIRYGLHPTTRYRQRRDEGQHANSKARKSSRRRIAPASGSHGPAPSPISETSDGSGHYNMIPHLDPSYQDSACRAYESGHTQHKVHPASTTLSTPLSSFQMSLGENHPNRWWHANDFGRDRTQQAPLPPILPRVYGAGTSYGNYGPPDFQLECSPGAYSHY